MNGRHPTPPLLHRTSSEHIKGLVCDVGLQVATEGLRIRRLTGDDLQQPAVWDAFHSFYLNTIDRKWGSPYLTR